jgi:hypothetical protein
MKRINATVPAALLLTFSMGVVPAFAAQQARAREQSGDRSGGQRETGRSQEQARPAEGQRAVPRAAAPAPAPHVEQAPRVEQAPARAERAERRTDRNQPERVERSRRAIPRVVVPQHVAPQIVVRPRGYVRPFYRPYYSFRPHVSLGFGLWMGYPVTYPYYYPYPSPTPYPYPYADPGPDPSYGYPSGSVNVMPNNTGGLSFDISPSSAAIYVDGQYAGAAADYSSTMPPLALTPGRHYIDIRADGFEPIVFDADVLVGQVIPYQGTMRRD